ncbi:MAG: M24 family metallopeptidase [bacterium]
MHDRIARVRARLDHHKLDALLVSSPVNVRYLFGFTGSNSLALITHDLSFFITDRRYIQQSEQQVQNAKIIIAKKDLISELKNIEPLPSGLKIGFESLHLRVKDYLELKKALPQLKLIGSERIVEGIASIKEPDEIENIRQAAAICSQVFADVLALIKPGISELDVSAEVSYRTRKLGSERDPFEPIVASGKRSALPHGISTSQKLSAGDLIIVDFGAVVNGYAADITRTVVLGELTPKQREMAEVVSQALEAAEAAARPGGTGKQLDEVARNYIRERGFGDLFQHSLGHGLGLDVHELPRIGEFSNDPIAAGNVITLEPGLYDAEHGGVRIEDDFVVTNSGVENLTPFSREVVSLG